MTRVINPNIISLPHGYKIEVVKTNLNTPVNLEILPNGDIYYGDSGLADGNGKLIKIGPHGEEVIADGFIPPLTGVTFYKGNFYVSHKQAITKVSPKGEKEDLIIGLPSHGDFSNNRVTFGPDGLMYFGQGTATNSGIVGLDNKWVNEYSYFHDYPAKEIILTGKNFTTPNLLNTGTVTTGAFLPFASPSKAGEKIRHILPGSGSILRAKPDGSDLESISWGFRNPYRIKFDANNLLWVANHGMDERGSRPIKNSPDEFTVVTSGYWYGWPDYTGGFPVTEPYFTPDNGPKPDFLIKEHPMKPPRPFVNFLPHTTICGFDFNPHLNFDYYGNFFISEFGPLDPMTTGGKKLTGIGHRVTRIDQNGNLFIFAQNHNQFPASESSGLGLERPIDVLFGPDEAMYILDFGIIKVTENDCKPIPNTGVIFKITRI